MRCAPGCSVRRSPCADRGAHRHRPADRAQPLVHGARPVAGLAEFIPIIGPLIGALPALLTALSVSPHQVLLTAIVFLVIQQLESNAIQPIIQAAGWSPSRRWLVCFPLPRWGCCSDPIGLILVCSFDRHHRGLGQGALRARRARRDDRPQGHGRSMRPPTLTHPGLGPT